MPGTTNGQMASSVDSAHGQTVEYSYDSLKRLTAAYYTTLSLTDPGFEQTGVNGWSLTGQAATTDLQYRSWPYSLQASGGGATATGVCSASATYTVSGYYLTAGGSSGTVTTLGAVTATETLAPATSWTAFSYAFVGPASCGGVLIALGGGQPNGSVYFDDISLTSPSVSSGANQISNPGFTLLTVSWSGSNARLTETTAHSGETSMLTVPGAWIGQTVSGLTANQSYTLSAYVSGGAAKLTAGSGSTTFAGGSGWTEIQVTGTASLSGTLVVAAIANGSGNVYWDDFSMNTTAGSSTGGQQFGYDGFGNLLSQTPVFGSAPMMSLTVNPNTNQVTSGGTVYDGAGNMTQDGGVTYTYDEMNRLTGTGTLSYSYSPGENKRMAVYGTIDHQPQQLLSLYLYGPDGKVLSNFVYQLSGSTWNPYAPSETNYLYMGGKALNWAENNIGSNASSTFWPYGAGNTGGGVFGTYQGDWSGFYYADQRYYNQSWGRFLTADPSSLSERSGFSQSWNRYAYPLGDPVNHVDSTGQFTTAEGCIDNPLVCLSQDGSGSIFGEVPELGAGGMDSCEATAFESLPENRAEEICDDEDQGIAPPPLQDNCSIDIFSRGVPGSWSPGLHSYLEVSDPDAKIDDILEGGPSLHPKNPFGNWGMMIGYVEPVALGGFLGGTNPASDANPVSFEGPGVCEDVTDFVDQVGFYDTIAGQVPYKPIPRSGSGYYNSNSFTYTLLWDAGLVGSIPTLNGWYPGWGLLVPGL